ncbi:MAG: pyruvate dehydrogenase (acetyl-transferring) E1 component subunit alpha [Spirochaetae bacterium HGW-Spirochaetae-9]|nr:MAG: pyruvate dehydrogenase (acetyl-transferring) E1 component subunit alpha [Spirochaetae bacterium HGW-Spirochaetae-9]
MSKSKLPALSRNTLLSMLEEMQLIRAFEEKAGQMYGLRKIGGFCHLYTGQEAVAVGAISSLDLAKDYVLTAYRDHGHALACGMDPKALMAELFGKVTGVSRGKGGSMHFFDAKRHMLGGNGIVGAQIPIATGVALSQSYEKTGGATLCFFGDGAFHQGALHESFNLARIWNLPIVYIVENNQWGMGTSWKKVSAQPDFASTAAAYSMKGYVCDGMDVVEVNEVVSAAVAAARKGEPSFIEARTYRYKGHSMSDPQKYRTRDEVGEYRKRDPILFLKGRLEDEKLISPEEWEAISSRVDVVVEEALQFAETSPEPAPGELYADMLA